MTRSTIEIYAADKNGCFFPLVILDVETLREQGFTGQLSLSFMGQINQLNVQAPKTPDRTPQDKSPVQSTNLVTGGMSDLGRSSLVENVTVFFAVAQSKV